MIEKHGICGGKYHMLGRESISKYTNSIILLFFRSPIFGESDTYFSDRPRRAGIRT
jgi:hypothetical protein